MLKIIKIKKKHTEGEDGSLVVGLGKVCTNPSVNLTVVLEGKSGIIKVSSPHPMRARDVCTNLHGNPVVVQSHSC